MIWSDGDDLLASINNISLLAGPCRYTNSDLMLLGSFYLRHCSFCPRVPESAEHLFVACPRQLELWASLLPTSSPLDCASAVAKSFGGAPPAIGHGVAMALFNMPQMKLSKLDFLTKFE
jgi:hypothetical protein